MSIAVVRYHQEAEGWWAETDRLPTLSAAGSSYEEVRDRSHTALRELLGDPNLEIWDDVTDVGAEVGVVLRVHSDVPPSLACGIRTIIGRGPSCNRKTSSGVAGVVFVNTFTR